MKFRFYEEVDTLTLKVMELFAGVGAWSKALENLEIDHEVVTAIEFDAKTINNYNLIHNQSFDAQDITKINENELPDCDIICYSPPCQAFSQAGKKEGFNDHRGILFFDALRIIKQKKPKFAIMENVKGLTQKKFANEFKQMLKELEDAGYTNYWKLLNAKMHGMAQSRERVFIVSIRNDINKEFEFPREFDSGLRLKDLLEVEVDHKYYLDQEITDQLILQLKRDFFVTTHEGNSLYQVGMLEIKGNEQIRRVYDPNGICPTLSTMQGGNRQPKIIMYEVEIPVKVREFDVDTDKLKQLLKLHKKQSGLSNKEIALKLGKPKTLVEHWFRSDNCFSIPDADIWFDLKSLLSIYTEEFDLPVTRFIVKKGEYEIANRVYDAEGVLCTLTAATVPNVFFNWIVRKLTPKEAIRIMGFDDKDYEVLVKNKVSASQIYKVAGNSIVVDVCEELFKQLLK